MENEKCNDKKCFRHGDVRVRGATQEGMVVSTKGKHTAIIEKSRTNRLSKYHRFAKEKSKIAAHNPPCINAAVGSLVRIGETRKLSRTKAWTIIEVISSEVRK